jgi:hypothetical protein
MRPWRPSWDRIASNMVVLISVVGVIVLSVYVVRQQEIVDRQQKTITEQQLSIECHSRYIQAFVTAFDERVAAGAEDRDAIRDFFAALGQPGVTAQDRLAAYNSYLARLAAADERRSGAPFPTERCGQ